MLRISAVVFGRDMAVSAMKMFLGAAAPLPQRQAGRPGVAQPGEDFRKTQGPLLVPK